MNISFKVLDKSWLFFGPFFLLLLGLDQWSKAWVLENLKLGEAKDFGLQLAQNNGIVFGIDMPEWVIYLLIIFILGFGAYLVFENKLWRDKWHLTGLALMLAGAIGNLIDRVRFGYVVDFIKIYWWPNFNLADVFIVSAVCLFAWIFIVREEGVSKI